MRFGPENFQNCQVTGGLHPRNEPHEREPVNNLAPSELNAEGKAGVPGREGNFRILNRGNPIATVPSAQKLF
jgi:hypothetical protein